MANTQNVAAINSRVAHIVSNYLEIAKSRSGKSQAAISEEMGFNDGKRSSNFLSLIKNGRSKLPIEQVESFINACGIEDGTELIEAIAEEYYGQIFSLVKKYKRISYSRSESTVMEAVIDAKREADTELRENGMKSAVTHNEKQKLQHASCHWAIDEERLSEFKKYIKNNLISK